MRKIKFKAWDVDGQIMLYSDFNAMGFYTKENPEYNAENTETVFMYHDYTGEKDYVLLQYSGMKDLGGNEIYEGDILHLDSHQDMQVKFKDGCFVAISTNRIQGLNWMPTALNLNVLLGYKVIGNIYENPELLEV